MTNFEKFQSLSIDELADVLRGFCVQTQYCDECPLLNICPEFCCEFKHTWIEWLNEEV